MLFHSSELDARDTGLKWLSDISGVSVSALLSAELEDDDWSRLSYGLGVLHDKRIFLADMPKDWQYVAKHGRRFAEAHPDLRLIVIDNIHSFLPLSSRKRSEDELFEALQGLKRLARHLSIPVVASLLTPCADETKEAATYHWLSLKDTILGVADVVLEIHKAQKEVREHDQLQVTPGVRVLKNRYSFSEDVDHGFFDRIRM